MDPYPVIVTGIIQIILGSSYIYKFLLYHYCRVGGVPNSGLRSLRLRGLVFQRIGFL